MAAVQYKQNFNTTHKEKDPGLLKLPQEIWLIVLEYLVIPSRTTATVKYQNTKWNLSLHLEPLLLTSIDLYLRVGTILYSSFNLQNWCQLYRIIENPTVLERYRVGNIGLLNLVRELILTKDVVNASKEIHGTMMFLNPEYLPSLKKIVIKESLESDDYESIANRVEAYHWNNLKIKLYIYTHSPVSVLQKYKRFCSLIDAVILQTGPSMCLNFFDNSILNCPNLTTYNVQFIEDLSFNSVDTCLWQQLEDIVANKVEDTIKGNSAKQFINFEPLFYNKTIIEKMYDYLTTVENLTIMHKNLQVWEAYSLPNLKKLEICSFSPNLTNIRINSFRYIKCLKISDIIKDDKMAETASFIISMATSRLRVLRLWGESAHLLSSLSPLLKQLKVLDIANYNLYNQSIANSLTAGNLIPGRKQELDNTLRALKHAISNKGLQNIEFVLVEGSLLDLKILKDLANNVESEHTISIRLHWSKFCAKTLNQQFNIRKPIESLVKIQDLSLPFTNAEIFESIFHTIPFALDNDTWSKFCEIVYPSQVLMYYENINICENGFYKSPQNIGGFPFFKNQLDIDMEEVCIRINLHQLKHLTLKVQSRISQVPFLFRSINRTGNTLSDHF